MACLGQLVSLKEYSLWDTRVLNATLNDVDGVIVEVVVDDAFADSIILSWVFHYWLLEVGFEVKHLMLQLESVIKFQEALKAAQIQMYNK